MEELRSWKTKLYVLLLRRTLVRQEMLDKVKKFFCNVTGPIVDLF